MIHHTAAHDIYECDRCEELVKVDKGQPPPPGYYLTIRRVQEGRRERKNWRRETSATPWFCDIQCFKEGIKFHTYSHQEQVVETETQRPLW